MSTLYRVGHALVVIAVVVLVGVFAVQAFPQVVGADQSYVVLSGSMEPEISTGDVVIVEDVPPSSIEAGDVVTYWRSGDETPTTHRVLAIQETEEGRQFVTKGDANEDPDPGTVSASALVGRVTFVIPYAGYVVNFANTRIGQLTLVGIPFGILVITEVVAYALGRSGRRSSSSTESASAEPASAVEERTASGDDGNTGHALDSGVETESPPDAAEEGVAITTADLQLTSIAFTLFTAYAGWMAYQHPGGLTVGVAVAAACGLLLIGLVFFAGEPETQTAAHGGSVTDGGVEPAPDADADEEVDSQ